MHNFMYNNNQAIKTIKYMNIIKSTNVIDGYLIDRLLSHLINLQLAETTSALIWRFRSNLLHYSMPTEDWP